MNRVSTKQLVRITGAIIFCACAIVVYAQFNDWMGRKLEARLSRKRPPEYFVMGTAVRLQVSSPANQNYSQLLRSRLESGLFAQDSRLRSETARPETIIACEITRIDADDGKWESRTTTEYQKTGERQEWNQKKSKYETKDVYNNVQVTRRYKVVKGGINISYKTMDAKTNATLDAQNIRSDFAREYLDGNGSLSAHEVREALVNSAVEKLTVRLVPTTEPLTVFLPRGKVESFSKMGQAGLWEKMREGAVKMGPLPKPSDEAYRQFGIGIANEALAYQAEALGDAAKLLEEAVICFNKAMELKPDEKYFRDPLVRIEQSLAQYKKLSGQLSAYAQAKAIAKPPDPAPASESKSISTPVQFPSGQIVSPAAPRGNSPAMTNQKVIAMVKAELDDPNVIAAVNSAPAVQFDLSADGQIALRTNKVSNAVINAMRERQNRRPAAPRRSTAPSRRKN